MDRSKTPRRSVSPMLVALVAVVGALVSWIQGCGLNTEGPAGGGGNGSGGHPATCDHDDAQCDDGNPCTVDTCTDDGLCTYKSLDDVLSPHQVAGDCKTNRCNKGKEESDEDPTDIKDDGEDCTDDACSDGKPVHTPHGDGEACKKAGMSGACKSGVCTVECSETKACPDPGPCASVACDLQTGTCVTTNVGDGTPTPGVTQTVGDCKQNICLNGKAVDQPDKSDIPHTDTDCDDELCDDQGNPSNPAHPKDSFCSTDGGRVCNGIAGAAKCVECTDTTVQGCPGLDGGNAPDDDCHQRTCNSSGQCQLLLASAGTATSTAPNLQTPGDCHQIQCDGAGHVVKVVADTDVPNDGNDCTNDLCNNGVASHSNESMGSPCGVSLACNASGQCNGCTLNTQCTAPNTCGGGGTPTVCGCTPTTCAAQGKTCGSINDGCFNPVLNCNNGAKNGTETDTDCGGDPNSCATRCGNGKTCSAGTDCASGNCVDGVCCDTACNGTCVACTAAKKGSGANGTCGAIKVGTDPDNECNPDAQSSCGLNGSCNGAGACQKYVSGTSCQAAFCTGTVLSKTDTCDGNGTCVDNKTQECAPYVCVATGCPTNCNTNGDADCSAGNFCDTSQNPKVCVSKKANGGTCNSSGQCQTGNCVDGFCCDTNCNGNCDVCSMALGATANGTCTTAAGYAGNPTCAPYLCQAGNASCPSSCTTDSQCTGGDYCDSTGHCVPQKANGQSCNLTADCKVAGCHECVNNNCVDGFCCNTACGGACDACASALGATTNGTCTIVTGSSGNPSCGAYLCQAGNAACPTTCSTDAQCAAGDYCDNTSHCVPQKAQGGTCNTTSDCKVAGCHECSTGNCVDGFCCDTACSGSCDACSVAAGAATNGTCSNVAAGTPGNPSCSGYLCGGTSAMCPTSCTADAQCASGDYCDNTGQCKPQKALGGSCNVGAGGDCQGPGCRECVSGNCVDGVCCMDACSAGTCMACSAAKKGAGMDGVCGFIKVGTDPDSECDDAGMASCGTNGSCDGAGACQLYSSATQCAAASCMGDSVVAARNCNGTGTCAAAGAATSCGKYTCNAGAGACYTSCPSDDMAGDGSCAAGEHCDGAHCVDPLIVMIACNRDRQCAMGLTCKSGLCAP